MLGSRIGSHVSTGAGLGVLAPDKKMADPVSTAYVLFLVVSHMTVSSTMLILNKAVLVLLPVASTVLLAQVGSSAVILWVLGKAKILTVDGFELKTVRILRLGQLRGINNPLFVWEENSCFFFEQ